MIQDLTEDEVRQDLALVVKERERLETEEMVLRQVLDLVIGQGRPASKPQLKPESQPRADADSDAHVPAKPATRPGSKRGPIKQIMRADAGRPWRAAEIRALLQERGYEVRPTNVRVTMRRMAEAGELVKVAEGQYVLPKSPDNGRLPLEEDD
jgi:pyruvate/2-oxoglutarate dehydrogenase complex dihydrolipoamide acyltransferase (E2) component